MPKTSLLILEQKHQLIRGCSSQLSLQIDRHLICMYESKQRGGYICFCSTEKCNPSQMLKPSTGPVVLSTVILLIRYIYAFA